MNLVGLSSHILVTIKTSKIKSSAISCFAGSRCNQEMTCSDQSSREKRPDWYPEREALNLQVEEASAAAAAQHAAEAAVLQSGVHAVTLCLWPDCTTLMLGNVFSKQAEPD